MIDDLNFMIRDVRLVNRKIQRNNVQNKCVHFLLALYSFRPRVGMGVSIP